jgi:hypothetical protein
MKVTDEMVEAACKTVCEAVSWDVDYRSMRRALTAALSTLLDHYAEMEAQKDAAYLERNKVVAALASVFPSGIARTAIEGWSDDWHGCVYIDLPTGQASWHYHDSQAHLFEHLPVYTGKWDGHDTEEKYRRVLSLRKTADRYAEGFSHAREMAIDAIGGQCCRVDTICVEAIRTMQPEENP